MPPSLQNVDHIHVHVTNRAAAEKWYADVLGFTRITELEMWATGDGPLTIGDATRLIRLALFESQAATKHAIIAFGVTAVEFAAWRAHLAKICGHTIEIFDHDVTWSLYFNDPDGNPFEITTHQYAALKHLLDHS